MHVKETCFHSELLWKIQTSFIKQEARSCRTTVPQRHDLHRERKIDFRKYTLVVFLAMLRNNSVIKNKGISLNVAIYNFK